MGTRLPLLGSLSLSGPQRQARRGRQREAAGSVERTGGPGQTGGLCNFSRPWRAWGSGPECESGLAGLYMEGGLLEFAV